MGSIVTSFIGGIQQVKAQGEQAGFQSGVAGQNASIAGAQAQQAYHIGSTQAGLAQAKGSQLASTQKADYAASGVVANAGSADTVQLNTKAMADLDAATIENNAARQAWGYKVQQSQYEQQGAWDIYSGGQQQQATLLHTAAEGMSGLQSFGISTGGTKK